VRATRKKYHVVRWPQVCKSKKQGRLEIKDIMKLNLSLLCKWCWKLETEKGIQQDIIGAKYLSGESICFVDQRHHDDSPIWANLLKARKHISSRENNPNQRWSKKKQDSGGTRGYYLRIL
jgi:hypothetical protein